MKSRFTESKHWGRVVKNFIAIAAVAVTLVGGALNAAAAGPAPCRGCTNTFPAGAVGECTMHQDHVLDSTPPVAGNYALTRVHVSSHTYDGLGLPCVECRGETPASPWSFRITRMQPVETMGCS